MGRQPVNLTTPAHVTVGAFDGIHRGHQHLIRSMTEAAHAEGRQAVVLTFDPHPGIVLGRRPVAALSTMAERAVLLQELGIDLLAIVHFTPAVAGLSAESFVQRLRQQLHMVELWVGANFALGHRREGDVAFLSALGEREGFAVRVVGPLEWQGRPVSSSRIRAALTAGDIEEANGCLGRPYRLGGTVIGGVVGRSLGVSTVRIDPPPGRLIPANGVYACRATAEAVQDWPAVVDVGVCPTVASNDLTVTAHLLDAEADLGGQWLELAFIARLRDERAFVDRKELAEQVRQDIVQAREILR